MLKHTFHPPGEPGHFIWETRYRLHGEDEQSIGESLERVARSLARAEGKHAGIWARRFKRVLADYRFLPGGRILAGAGAANKVTLFNCFVMGGLRDDMTSIFEHLKESALTLQAGGGIGCDFSTLRPSGVAARTTGHVASGPVSYMHIWDTMCRTVKASGARRGAMIATVRCDHPDIEAFVNAKLDSTALTHFNLSVLITDDFMEAVEKDRDWPLVFPAVSIAESEAMVTVVRHWPGFDGPIDCVVLGTRRARELWRDLVRASHGSAEPGILFVDRINEMNNLYDREHITCTNPCGEVPLPEYGACDLGSVNLARFVTAPFTANAGFDYARIRKVVHVATRMLDNVIDCSLFPLPQQEAVAKSSRRIGIGVSGLADALIMLGLGYGTDAGRDAAEQVMAVICNAAYEASTGLAREKGAFPLFERDKFLSSRFVQSRPDYIRDLIADHGIRNSHLVSIAPAGTISLLAGNISSGIEPVFDLEVTRRILAPNGAAQDFVLPDYAYEMWRQTRPGAPLPPEFVSAGELPPEAHLAMQAGLQRHVDNAISKTINLPEDCTTDEVGAIFRAAFRLGLKGCTIYRTGTRNSVLRPGPACRLDIQGTDCGTT